MFRCSCNRERNLNSRGGSGEAEARRNANSKFNSTYKNCLVINTLSATERSGEGWGEVNEIQSTLMPIAIGTLIKQMYAD